MDRAGCMTLSPDLTLGVLKTPEWRDDPMFQMLVANVGVLAIAGLYYAWRDGYHHKRLQSARAILRDRVAYMVWTAANRYA